MAAMPMHLIEVQSMGQDLAQKTVCVKVRLGRLGNTRKVSNSQVEVDTDKSLLLISKHLLDSKELRAVANFDGEIRRYLYDTCLPFEAGIHLCPLALLEQMEGKPLCAKINETPSRPEFTVEGGEGNPHEEEVEWRCAGLTRFGFAWRGAE